MQCTYDVINMIGVSRYFIVHIHAHLWNEGYLSWVIEKGSVIDSFCFSLGTNKFLFILRKSTFFPQFEKKDSSIHLYEVSNTLFFSTVYTVQVHTFTGMKVNFQLCTVVYDTLPLWNVQFISLITTENGKQLVVL